MTFGASYGRIYSVYQKICYCEELSVTKYYIIKEGKGNYNVNNLDGKLENSKIPAVVASDVNDDEVEMI